MLRNRVIFNWKTSIENCRKKGLKLQTGKTIATDFFFNFLMATSKFKRLKSRQKIYLSSTVFCRKEIFPLVFPLDLDVLLILLQTSVADFLHQVVDFQFFHPNQSQKGVVVEVGHSFYQCDLSYGANLTNSQIFNHNFDIEN